MKLAECAGNTDNNFHLLRILAAFAVLVTHSFALSTGSADAEPFRQSMGMTMGSVAVDIFFIVSGFLVTGSLLKTRSAIAFFWARVLRIYPALVVMLVLLVFVLGPLFTTLPLASYFAAPRTYSYFVKCATLVWGVNWTLPGVFHFNPAKDAVNGSLWTMPHEIHMYGILLVTWIALGWRGAERVKLFQFAILTAMTSSGMILVGGHLLLNIEIEGWFMKLFFMFFTGAGFYVLRERITLRRSIFWIFVVGLVVSGLVSRQLFFVVYVLTIAYIVFYVVYVPVGTIRRYNRLGDYPYGMYIYAFPIQQTVAACIPGVSVPGMVVLSTIGTLFMAVLSWHLLEKRALKLRARFTQQTQANALVLIVRSKLNGASY
jgi:peptidoglycan/LPS O-acetylase OafA/YrhL